jgi:hypothetical protein
VEYVALANIPAGAQQVVVIVFDEDYGYRVVEVTGSKENRDGGFVMFQGYMVMPSGERTKVYGRYTRPKPGTSLSPGSWLERLDVA